MHALKGLALGLGLGLQTIKLRISQDVHIEGLPGVLFLLRGPLAVLFIERGPVVVNVLVYLDITDLERGEALVEAVLDAVARVIEDVEDQECDHQGPFDTIPALVRKDAGHGMAGDVGVRG